MPNVTYYSFRDLFTKLNLDSNYYKVPATVNIGVFCTAVNSTFHLNLALTYQDSYCAGLFSSVWRRFIDNAIIKVPEGENEDTYYKKWLNVFYSHLIETHSRYKEICAYYESSRTKLMDQISSGNDYTTRFNDTPMDGGAFDDDNHTTNITEFSSSSGTDGDTKVSRLAEINSKLVDIYKQWSDEFEKIFIEEEV